MFGIISQFHVESHQIYLWMTPQFHEEFQDLSLAILPSIFTWPWLATKRVSRTLDLLHYGIYKLIGNSNFAKCYLLITYFRVVRSIWNFAQSTAVILPCFVQNFKMIGQSEFILWANKFWLWDEIGRDIVHWNSPHGLLQGSTVGNEVYTCSEGCVVMEQPSATLGWSQRWPSDGRTIRDTLATCCLNGCSRLHNTTDYNHIWLNSLRPWVPFSGIN